MAARKTGSRAARRPASKLKMSRRQPSPGGMTVREAGRPGGLIGGRKGGLAVKGERGGEFVEQIGKKGGDTGKAERGAGFYEQIGKKGGEAVKAERGTPFYGEIGKKGGHRVRTLIEEGKKAATEAAAAAMNKPEEDKTPAPGG